MSCNSFAIVLKTLMLVALGGLAAAGHAQPIDFRGVPLGASEKAWMDKIPDVPCRPSRPGADLLGDRQCSIFREDGQPASPAFRFDDTVAYGIRAGFYSDRLLIVQIVIDTDNFGMTLIGLREKFGNPEFLVSHPYFSIDGRRQENTTAKWQRENGTVEAVRFSEMLRKGVVTYTHSDHGAVVKRMIDERSEELKRQGKGTK